MRAGTFEELLRGGRSGRFAKVPRQVDAVRAGGGGEAAAAAAVMLAIDALDGINGRDACHSRFLKAAMVVKTTAIYIPLRTVQEKSLYSVIPKKRWR